MMASWTLFTFDRTEYRIDVTFVILFGWLVVSALVFAGVGPAINTAVFVAIVFGSVFLHELGHLFAAKAFDVRTTSVTLHFFGGVASFARQPQTWTAENLISFAGPAVNLAIALVLLALVGDLSYEAIRLKFLGLRLGIVDDIIYVNLFLGLFNLLPALPFDGGRILRGLLAPRIGMRNGTLIPGYLGVLVGGYFVLSGLFRLDTFVAILGAFIALSAWNWVQWAQGIANRPGGGGGRPRP
ncbi:MAG: hypothetical protein IT535_13065 [Bauldia sp.]|nr:hypothetical protein [Bauldia sp.]